VGLVSVGVAVYAGVLLLLRGITVKEIAFFKQVLKHSIPATTRDRDEAE